MQILEYMALAESLFALAIIVWLAYCEFKNAIL